MPKVEVSELQGKQETGDILAPTPPGGAARVLGAGTDHQALIRSPTTNFQDRGFLLSSFILVNLQPLLLLGLSQAKQTPPEPILPSLIPPSPNSTAST